MRRARSSAWKEPVRPSLAFAPEDRPDRTWGRTVIRNPLAAFALAAAFVGAPAARAAAPDAAAEVAARAAERGILAEPLVAPVREAERRGLPPRLVADKVLEGIAKGVPPERVAAVAGALVSRLSEADEALARAPAGVAPPRDRPAALADLAGALAAGVDRASLDALVAAARSGSAGADGAVAAARVLAGLGRRGVPASDALPLGRALAANPRSAADVVPAFDAWRADGGQDMRAFIADAERRVAQGRAVSGAGHDADRGGRDDAGRDERGRGGGDAGRPHGRHP